MISNNPARRFSLTAASHALGMPPMRPAKQSFEVRCAVPGALKVLVVDATNNIRKAEHDMTRTIVEALKQRNVPVTANSPVLATDVRSFAAAFETEETWNTLLLLSHGRAVAGEGVDILRLGDWRTHWFLANAVDMKLEDKAVFLGVCEGACEDATYVLLRDQLALLLVAPTGKLTTLEAIAFFPPALAELLGHEELTPELVHEAIRKHGALAGGKMTIQSGVGLAE
ncbi:hypothetical protein [Sorangium sp. So ce1182]|uniref:hypothetical protein n=1 Tax=Sorangium sp. So ce1182 TaxID=3133334 RepID=UPI003F5EBBDE